ncbi:MAG: hypothetical protein IJ558_00455 [Treponema sp.]|nr:hypothetical protein [Treponema sp.]
MTRRTPFLAFFLLLTLPAFFAQTPLRRENLQAQTPSWQAVIGGEAVSPCIETSYGVALLSDGRLLSACTSAGTVIWQRSIKGRPSPYLSAFGDFLYVVTDRTHLNLVNPSGMTLWTAIAPFEITDFPLVGRDGRVFVKGKKGIACYGLNGTRKWQVETDELGSLPFGVLDDGSLLVYARALKDDKTVALRFSPFGERLEDITFSGTVSSAENSEKGVIISLTNGSIGLVRVAGGSAEAKWVTSSGNTTGAFKICYSPISQNTAFFFQNGSRTEAVIVNTDSGEVKKRFQVGQIASSDFQIARATSSGFFISGAYSACEFTETGTILYAADLPARAKWTSLCYTDKNYLVLCMKDWTMTAFLMSGAQPAKKIRPTLKSLSYVNAQSVDSVAKQAGIRPLTEAKMTEIAREFKAGDYGEKECEYLSLIKAEAQNYIDAHALSVAFRGEPSFFEENAVYTQDLLYLMSQTGTREFSSYFARLLASEDDLSQLSSIIAFAGTCAYDENAQMLKELEALLRKIPPKNSALLKQICDATYEICRFMGRPAFNRQGRTIISYLFYPQYDKTVRTYARTILTKMVDLEKK